MPETLAPANSSAIPPPPAPASRRRWSWWALGALALLLGAAALVLLGLDPWLRRQLEQQVTTQTHGQYRLRVGALRTRLWQRAVHLHGLRLRPAATVADTLPRVRFDAARLSLTGIGLWALLRRDVVPLDSLVLDSARLDVRALARRPGLAAPRPLHERLPLRIKGLQLGYLGLLRAEIVFGPAGRRRARLDRADVHGRDLLLSAAGAADSQRLGYAIAWDARLRHGRAQVAGHRLGLQDLRLATAAGKLELDTLSIRPPGPGRGRPGGVRVDLALPRLALTGLDAAALQHARRFRATALVLDRPRLDFTPPAQPPPPVWKLLAKALRRADLARLQVNHAELRISGLRHLPEVRDVSVRGRAIRIDSLAARDPNRLAYARAWQGRTGRVMAPFDPPYYRASSQHAQFDTDARTFRFEDLALTPRYSAMGTNRHKGYQAPAIRIHLAALAASGLDFSALLRDKDFRIGHVVAQRPVVHIDSDGRGPINPNKSKISPEEMIHLPVTVDVRRLDIVGGNLYSSYRSPLTPIPGRLSINRFNGTFRNLTNDPRRQTAATPLTGRATTYLQNRVRLDARVAMYLLDPQGRHRVWGVFGPGPFGILNTMTVPTRLVEFRKGDVQRIRFDMQASRTGTTGTMRAEYTGLQLKLLSYKQDEIKPSLLKNIVSKAANVLVIRDQNPRKRGELVTGAMTSTREPRFSVFTLWRQGIVSGLFNNVGIPQRLAQKLSESKDEAPLPK